MGEGMPRGVHFLDCSKSLDDFAELPPCENQAAGVSKASRSSRAVHLGGGAVEATEFPEIASFFQGVRGGPGKKSRGSERTIEPRVLLAFARKLAVR